MLMQDALARLTAYWTARGCQLRPPSDAGADPAAFLRVLEAPPWRAVCAGPSAWPGDAHTGLHVVLQPAPDDPEELYLGSLAALGIDVAAHDVRFVADDWAVPALGVRGPGGEVWLDGLVVGRVTRLRRVGGVRLEAVPVEITYGVAQILAVLGDEQRRPAAGSGRAEVDVAAQRRLFEQHAAQAHRHVDAGQPERACADVLKCSHAFHELDASGAVSPADRPAAVARMRRLAGKVARLWTADHAQPEHPLAPVPPRRPVATAARPAGRSGPRTLILEIGTGELPPAEAGAARERVRRELAAGLAAAGFGHGEVRVFATPRRLVAMVGEVGGGTVDELAGVLARVVTAGCGERTGGAELRSGRPIRWLTALWGDDVVPVAVAGLAAGRRTRVLRTAPDPEPAVASAETFMETLALAGVVADPEDRHDLIVTGAQDLVYPDGRVDVRAEAALIDRLAWLVEAPTPLLGTFDESFLPLPAPVLTTVLRRQHCLPVRDAGGALLPMFVTVANGPVDVELVREGHEAVLRAGFEEAADR